MHFSAVPLALFGLLALATAAPPSPETAAAPRAASVKHNDFSCRSKKHPNPVVLLHGLGATYYEDLNVLEAYLQTQDFCTFSLTYGAYAHFPYVGGLKPINESAAQIAAFMRRVHAKTGAAKLDVVGHSEGGFQTLYVPKFEGVSGILRTLVAIAPPSHGTTFGGLTELVSLFGNLGKKAAKTVLDTVGCDACDDLIDGGAAVMRLDRGKIVQPGNKLTVIASTHDELVTPTYSAFVNETGVTNEYVQKYCPLDRVGHIGEAYDTNVWNMVINALQDTPKRKFVCTFGAPGKR